MHHPGKVSLVLLGLSLWPDLGLALPKSQATFARDMRGDMMYNVADAGEQVRVLSLSTSPSLSPKSKPSKKSNQKGQANLDHHVQIIHYQQMF